MPRNLRRHFLAGAVLAGSLATLAPQLSAKDGENGVPAQGPLDGMSFVGTLGPEGKPGDRDDVIHFADGQFLSEGCVPCGFSPGPYWVRFEDEAIHFRGELSSAENGTFSYSGVVQGDRLSVSLNWRKERWYWSIDRNFWFEGTMEATMAAAPEQSPAGVALAAATDPRICEP
jgi:hypothetical protein